MTRTSMFRGFSFGMAASLLAAMTSGAAAQEQRLLLRPDRPEGPTPRLGIVGYVEYGHGLVVERVAPFTPAARLGLEPGDVILRVNDQRIRRDGDLQRALRFSGGYVRLLVDDVRGNGAVWTRTVSLQGGRGPSRPMMQREELVQFAPQAQTGEF